jgi:hypothetical protein
MYNTTALSADTSFFLDELNSQGFVLKSKNVNKKARTVELYVQTKEEKLQSDRDKKINEILNELTTR